MDGLRIQLAPGVPELASLGARSFEDFFRTPGEPGFERAELVRSLPGFELVRAPLPGTPDPGGGLRGAPRGAGTGWIRIGRWTGAAFAERWRARLRAPRSTSFAEREWNLVCHLRAAGVATPEPLAVGRGAGGTFARRSFLVLRELEGLRPLSEWLREPLDRRSRARIARALGRTLLRLFRSGARLPELGTDTIWAGPPRPEAPEAPEEACVARTIEGLRAAARGLEPPSAGGTPVAGLRWGRLPEIALSGFAGGSLGPPCSGAERARVLLRLARESAASPAAVEFAAEVALGATADLERDLRRRVLRELARTAADARR